jgi:phage terminase small subunit
MSYQELDSQQQAFIDRYLATLDPTTSAIDAKYNRLEAGKIAMDLLSNNTIKEAIKERRTELNQMVNEIEFEKEDLMRIYWDMFNDAKRKGKLADARSILSDIAKYNGVNPDEVKKEIAILNFNLDGSKI